MVDTVPGSTASTVALDEGIIKFGTIETDGDHDWYRITLIAGEKYTFSVGSSGTGDMTDSFLRLRNSLGTILLENDDDGAGLLSQIAFTATTTGTYYVDVGSFGDTGTGNFSLLAVRSTKSGADLLDGHSNSDGFMMTGASSNGVVNTIGDHDWYAVSLTAGVAYQFSTSATGGANDVDTYLSLRTSSGTQLAENDDSNGTIYSSFRFTPTTSGIYYIDVGAYNNETTGAFKVNFATAPPLTLFSNDQIADFLLNGYWGGPTSAHHFAATPGGSITINISGLTAAGQTLAREAFNLWTDVIGVSFTEVLTSGQIVVDDLEPGAFAETVYSNGITSSGTVNIGTDWLQSYGTTINSYSFQAYVHEIGHVLGLGHGGPYNSTAAYGADAAYLNDSWATTVMSYFDQIENIYFKNQGFTLQYALSPMSADIVAVYQSYGASTTTRTGNTVYGFNNSSGRAIYDAAVNPSVSYTIVDSGGIDTLDYSGSSAAQKINLNPETFSNVLGRTGNVSIGRGTVIENAIGGSGQDQLIGNAVANILSGGANVDSLFGNDGADTLNGGDNGDMLDGGNGDDILRGDDGFDTLIGGAGSDILDGGVGPADRVDYTSSVGAIFLDLAGHYAAETNITTGTIGSPSGALSIDTLIDIENVTGSQFGDRIYGDSGSNDIAGLAGDDIIYGEGGDDSLRGSAGSDILIGGAGNDSILYNDGVGSIYLDLNAGFALETELQSGTVLANTPTLSIDLLSGVEHALGTPYGDRIYGSSAANSIDGGDGDDIIYGEDGDDIIYPGTGSDVALGGLGQDTIDYSTAAGAIFADLNGGFTIETELATGTVSAATPSISTDLHAQFENLVGSSFGDRLYGTSGINSILGGSGNDYIFGGAGDDDLNGDAGDDRLIGEAGADTLTGGDGADRFYFSTAPELAMDTITDFAAGLDKLYLQRAAFGIGAAETLNLVIDGPATGVHCFLYDSIAGILKYDSDGAGAGAAFSVAFIGTGLPLSAADLILYG